MGRMTTAALIARVIGGAPVSVSAYDGSSVGPADANVRLVLRSPRALSYLLMAPSSLRYVTVTAAEPLQAPRSTVTGDPSAIPRTRAPGTIASRSAMRLRFCRLPTALGNGRRLDARHDSVASSAA